MSIITIMFYFFEVLAAVSAIALLLTKNVFYGALLLIVCLLSIAGIYILTFAEFIAVTQILVYAGGILVVIIFGIMLTSKIAGKALVVDNTNWFAAILVGLFFFVLLADLFLKQTFVLSDPVKSVTENTIHTFGVLLLSDYILPFEISGMLLLITLVGAAISASSVKQKS